mmetsp:Transcript_20500/g.57201  ORF Transcript_20500/g.57201 Transcript_20500/m.57201 type:complete len:275 (+) Transcript_20500:3910-4734(+)
MQRGTPVIISSRARNATPNTGIVQRRVQTTLGCVEGRCEQRPFLRHHARSAPGAGGQLSRVCFLTIIQERRFRIPPQQLQDRPPNGHQTSPRALRSAVDIHSIYLLLNNLRKQLRVAQKSQTKQCEGLPAPGQRLRPCAAESYSDDGLAAFAKHLHGRPAIHQVCRKALAASGKRQSRCPVQGEGETADHLLDRRGVPEAKTHFGGRPGVITEGSPTAHQSPAVRARQAQVRETHTLARCVASRRRDDQHVASGGAGAELHASALRGGHRGAVG